MDAETIIAALGIYKPEAKLIETSTSEQRCKSNLQEDLGVNAYRCPEGCLYNPYSCLAHPSRRAEPLCFRSDST